MVEIAGTREITEETRYKPGATTAQRFPKSRRGNYRYVAGTSWVELKPTQFRNLNFAFGRNGVGECYLSEINGYEDDGLSNINRWRGQMQLEPLTAEQLAELPKHSIAGLETAYVSIEGAFQGMGSAQLERGYQMLAMLYHHNHIAFSVKMIGPAYAVAPQESEFLAFCETLSLVNPVGDPPSHLTSAPAAPPRSAELEEREGFAKTKVGPFELLLPDGWKLLPADEPNSKLSIRFTFGPHNEGSCGFGAVDSREDTIESTINGWQTTMGKEALSLDQIQQLPLGTLLGHAGLKVDMTHNDQRLAGIVASLHESITIFLQIKGPEPLISQNLEAFHTLTETMRIGAVAP